MKVSNVNCSLSFYTGIVAFEFVFFLRRIYEKFTTDNAINRIVIVITA